MGFDKLISTISWNLRKEFNILSGNIRRADINDLDAKIKQKRDIIFPLFKRSLSNVIAVTMNPATRAVFSDAKRFYQREIVKDSISSYQVTADIAAAIIEQHGWKGGNYDIGLFVKMRDLNVEMVRNLNELRALYDAHAPASGAMVREKDLFSRTAFAPA